MEKVNPKDSLEQSLIEMNLIRRGKMKGKSWREYREELKEDLCQNDLWLKAE